MPRSASVASKGSLRCLSSSKLSTHLSQRRRRSHNYSGNRLREFQLRAGQRRSAPAIASTIAWAVNYVDEKYVTLGPYPQLLQATRGRPIVLTASALGASDAGFVESPYSPHVRDLHIDNACSYRTRVKRYLDFIG